MLAQIWQIVVLLITGVAGVNGANRVEKLILVETMCIVCYLPGLQMPHQLQLTLCQEVCRLYYLRLVGNHFCAEELLRGVTREPCALGKALLFVFLVQSHVLADTWMQHVPCLPFPRLAKLQFFYYPAFKAWLLRVQTCGSHRLKYFVVIGSNRFPRSKFFMLGVLFSGKLCLNSDPLWNSLSNWLNVFPD